MALIIVIVVKIIINLIMMIMIILIILLIIIIIIMVTIVTIINATLIMKATVTTIILITRGLAGPLVVQEHLHVSILGLLAEFIWPFDYIYIYREREIDR